MILVISQYVNRTEIASYLALKKLTENTDYRLHGCVNASLPCMLETNGASKDSISLNENKTFAFTLIQDNSFASQLQSSLEENLGEHSIINSGYFVISYFNTSMSFCLLF